MSNDTGSFVVIFFAVILMALAIVAITLVQLITDPLPYLALSLPVFLAGMAVFHHRYGFWPGVAWWRLWAAVASIGVLIDPPVHWGPTFAGGTAAIILGCFAWLEFIVWSSLAVRMLLSRRKKQVPERRSESPPLVPSADEEPEKPAFGRRSSPPPVSYRNSR